MNHLNLVMKFRLANHDQCQVKGATRIKLDGRGGLTLYDVQSGHHEKIEIRQLRSFSLRAISQAA